MQDIAGQAPSQVPPTQNVEGLRTELDAAAGGAFTLVSELARTTDDLKAHSAVIVSVVRRSGLATLTEPEIEALRLKAQSFIERAVGDAHVQTTRIREEALAHAEQILSEARGHAEQIKADADRSASVSPDVLVRFQQTVAAFTYANNELADQLFELNSSLPF